MTTFAIDIDSTLYDLTTPARDGFLKFYELSGDREWLKGAYMSWDEWRSPTDACGLDAWLKVVEYCHSPEVIAAQVPFAGASDTLNALVKKGYDLVYISHRSMEASDATEEWLELNNFPIEYPLHCTADKKELMSHCQYLIDDRPKTLIEFVYDPYWDGDSDNTRKAWSILYPYNRALTDIPNIYLAPTWAGIRSYMERKGIL